MLTMKDIHILTSRPKRAAKSVLTVYLNVDQSQQANWNRGFERQLKDMITGVRTGIGSETEWLAFDASAQRVTEFVGKYQGPGRAIAAIYDAADQFFWAYPVDLPLENRVDWGYEALIAPLAAALDEHEQLAIAIFDRANLRLFTMFLGEVQEHIWEKFDHKKVRHTKTVGMDMIGAASRAQQKSDEQIRLNLRWMSKSIDAMMADYGIRRLLLAGSPEITAMMKGLLPKRLASFVIGTTDLAISASLDEIRRVAAPIGERFEGQLEESMVADLLTSASKGRQVVTGLARTLNALNERRVWELVYTDDFKSPGYECAQCGALFVAEVAACSFCASELHPVADVVARAVDYAIRKHIRIELIRNADALSDLANAGGIGAFLRTRMVARAS